MVPETEDPQIIKGQTHMRLFGWFVAIMMILGMFNIIDMHICIAGKGKCPVTQNYKDNK